MDSEKILKSDLLDLIFEGRNKNYGAYFLRRNYPKYVGRALLAAVIIAVLFIGYALLSSKISDMISTQDVKVDLANIPPPPPMDETKPPPPPPPPAPPPPERASVQYVPPKVTKDELVQEKVELATVEDLKKSDPGTKNVKGDPNAKVVIDANSDAGIVMDDRKVGLDEPKKDDENEIFKVVEQNPEFPGGTSAMTAFLRDNIKYPAAARENGLQGKVFIGFVVEKNGKITAARIIKDPVGGGAGQEALRVVNEMPNWKPGRQNGKPVRVAFTLPVTFKLQD
jgi:protein TonB